MNINDVVFDLGLDMMMDLHINIIYNNLVAREQHIIKLLLINSKLSGQSVG